MIKKRFLEPFQDIPSVRADILVFTNGLSLKSIASFLESASDDELHRIGKAVFYLYPANIREQLANKRKDSVDYSFIDDYTRTYNIDSTTTSKDKSRGSALLVFLRENPNMDATEFCKKLKL